MGVIDGTGVWKEVHGYRSHWEPNDVAKGKLRASIHTLVILSISQRAQRNPKLNKHTPKRKGRREKREGGKKEGGRKGHRNVSVLTFLAQEGQGLGEWPGPLTAVWIDLLRFAMAYLYYQHLWFSGCGQGPWNTPRNFQTTSWQTKTGKGEESHICVSYTISANKLVTVGQSAKHAPLAVLVP